MRADEFITEGWTKKYKKSINCSSPKGFSQKAHCAGRKKNEGVAEGKDFDRCFDQACKLYDQAVNKNLKPKLVQVADFQGDGNGADARWMKLPQHVWQHYVVIVGDQVLDPTAKQFGDSMPTQYQVSDLDRLWGKQYQIRPRQGVADDLDENLRKWFKDKWVRFGPDGKIRGDCARGSEKEGKPKCLPQSKAHSLGKKGRATAASRKRREDPNPNRSGKAINVRTK